MSRDQLLSVFVEHGERIHGTARARAQELLAIHALRREKDRDVRLVQYECIGRRGDAVAEADAQRAIDAYAERADDALVDVVALLLRAGHYIPSSPSSVRARSITSGVISAIAWSTAYSV